MQSTFAAIQSQKIKTHSTCIYLALPGIAKTSQSNQQRMIFGKKASSRMNDYQIKKIKKIELVFHGLPEQVRGM